MTDPAGTSTTGQPSRSVRPGRKRAATFAGVVAALLAMQIALMPLSSGLHRQWAPITSDAVEGPVVTQRWYFEGIAESHFSAAGARLTGNAFLPDAPVGVVLGDSYVEAMQLADTLTIGSVLERAARREGSRVNVRQYGMSGASAATYARMAKEVVQRWHPSFVAVILTEDDFMNRAPFTGADRLVLHGDSSVAVEHTDPTHGALLSRMRDAAARLLEQFTLADKLVVRAARISETIASDDRAPRAPTPDTASTYASVRGLRDAYGDRLTLVYVPTVAVVADDDRSTNEAVFLQACATLRVRCASAGAMLRQDRATNHRLSRGFGNSTPGSGHLNAVGAALVGSLAWAMVDSGPPAVPATR